MRISDWSSDVCSSDLVRDETVRVAVSPSETLRGGDRLVFVGATNAIRELRRMPGLRLARDQVFKIDDAPSQRHSVQVVVSSYSPAVARPLVHFAFRDHYNTAATALARPCERFPGKPRHVPTQPG